MVSASAWLDEDVASKNVCVVTGSNSVLVVDTKLAPGISADVLMEIRKLTPKPISYVVLTHYRSVREFAKVDGDQYLTVDSDLGLGVPLFAVPPRSFVLNSRVFLDKLEIQILQLGVETLNVESMVWIPSEFALILGGITDVAGLVTASDIPSYFQRWLFALNSISSLELHTLVPSYGPPLIGAEAVATGLTNAKNVLTDLYSKAKSFKSEDGELKSAFIAEYAKLIAEHRGPFMLNRCFIHAS